MQAVPEAPYDLDAAGDELRFAARTGDVAVITSLLASAAGHSPSAPASVLASADPRSGNTALHMAAANGHAGALSALVDAGAPVDARNGAGSCPLHYCAAGRSGECARVLVEARAGLFIENEAGATAMDEALRFGGGVGGEVAVVLAKAAEGKGGEGVEVELGLGEGEDGIGGEEADAST